MPPVTSGLGTCTTDTLGKAPLYSAGGGVANQAWLDTAAQVGGGTPYYLPFKAACQAAYAWQYDDIARYKYADSSSLLICVSNAF